MLFYRLSFHNGTSQYWAAWSSHNLHSYPQSGQIAKLSASRAGGSVSRECQFSLLYIECETYGRFLHIVHIVGQQSSSLNFAGTRFDDPRPQLEVSFFFLQPAARLTHWILVQDFQDSIPFGLHWAPKDWTRPDFQTLSIIGPCQCVTTSKISEIQWHDIWEWYSELCYLKVQGTDEWALVIHNNYEYLANFITIKYLRLVVS